MSLSIRLYNIHGSSENLWFLEKCEIFLQNYVHTNRIYLLLLSKVVMNGTIGHETESETERVYGPIELTLAAGS